MNCVYDNEGKYFVISDRLISFNVFTASTKKPCICFNYGEHGEYNAVFKSHDYRDSVFQTVVKIIREQL